MAIREQLKQAQVVTEEARKIALEKRMIPGIRSLFSQMVTEYMAKIASTASVPSAADFQNEWAALFLTQYRRVGREFLDNQRGSKFYAALTTTKQELEPAESAGVVSTFAAWSRSFAANQASFVARTNQKDYVTAFERAVEETDSTSPAVIAAAAGVILRRLFKGREGAIANVQTQAPAEQAKRIEAEALARSEDKPDSEITKTWRTVGDEKVRPAHNDANGQVRNADEAFSVGGENLMFPGDSSLGASAGNIINCRCAAIWS